MRGIIRHMKIPVVLTLVVAALGGGCANAATTKPARPRNVLLIISDDLCADLGCYGAPVVTPHIDRLAAHGLRFDRAYCQYPLCGPSRCSFMSGLRPETVGVVQNGLPVRHKLKDVVTLPQLFRQNGYFSARVGKIYHMNIPDGVGKSGPDDPQSWDYTFNPPGAEFTTDGDQFDPTPKNGQGFRRVMDHDPDGKTQHDYEAATEAIRLLDEHKEKPFFLAVGFIRPHVPEIAPKKYFDLYDIDKIQLPAGDRRDIPPMAFHYKTPNLGMNEADCRESKRAYYATTSFMDAQAGRVLDELDRLGLRDDTLVVFMSDHGYLLGQHQSWQKWALFEEGARVPMIIDSPGMTTRGRSTNAIVESIDLFPTLADLCGLTPPKELQGRSMAPMLRDPNASIHDAAYTVIQLQQQKGRSVRTDRWRYTEWDNGRAGAELYDHASDPREQTNLAKDPAHAATVRELSAMLRASAPTTESPPAPATTRAAMSGVRLAPDGHGFALDDGQPFVPWGFNYDRDYRMRLIEDYWDSEWPTVVEDFREIKALGANVVRVHLQFGRFMDAPDRPNQRALDRLEQLTETAESLGLYLDVTGLGCYRKQDVPAWYDALDEPRRWSAQAHFWEAVAQCLADRPGVFAYDLMNEPVVPDQRLPAGDWLVNIPLGGFYYVQHITLDPAGRDRAEIARQWTHTLVAAIRKHDARHMITVGLLPNSVDGASGATGGFTPRTIAPEVDYLSVHVYPQHGKADESLALLRQFAAFGRPVVVEEMFPLACSTDELGDFIDRSRDQHLAAGWLGFYWGRTIDQMQGSTDAGDALTVAWLKLFQKDSPHEPVSAK
jgi:iduronate 2-sulfatase